MEGDPMGVALPEDALAEILRRLPPRSLATSRCVCKAWRSIVDGRRLLLPELLPHSVRGIFLEYNEASYPGFLSHPSMEPDDILGKLNFHRLRPDPYQWTYTHIEGHCNGLLLYRDRLGLQVANPATQWRARLPPPPETEREGGFVEPHLAFDPTESLHYEILLVPQTPLAEERDQPEPSKEWPASTWVLCLFSSRTGQWEQRAFLREGEAAGMASDEVLHRTSDSCSTYWHGMLFVQCNGGFTVMRISLSNNKYRVIKIPTDIEESEYYKLHLGRSREGLCCATFRDRTNLRVWILDDSCGTMEWALKHHIDLDQSLSRVMWHCGEKEGPWSLQDAINVEHYGQQDLNDVNMDEDHSNNSFVKSEVEWDSDNDNIGDNESEVVESYLPYVCFLGFHPYKEVIFLNLLSLRRAVAYHLNTSIVQDLGNIWPNDYDAGHARGIYKSFLYTPCLIADFPENKLEAHVAG
ncbi:putative F-box protein At1g19160 [Aegilops tauschii subsp. strangulata]|uniref:F-box domain-containing protein n=2 Tax=Aegilops tauschii subsp. strangulata TaxID=200361 RepID=A0A452Z812_AEGTS|nr:uncharacterized protein LOC109784099 [Aegilops tauschii subsp. strangulata]